MKKSYFAIGAVVAAMCSCSSESIPSAGEGNVLPGTEDLSPISLAMTGNKTSVEVGSRTRGTGNVGGADEKTWQNEKLYVLMTSSDPLCLSPADAANGWGFVNLNGNGPWLREQFNGAIWARPNAVDPDGVPGTDDEYWNLVYNHTNDLENNDWYQGAGVNRFYPINGVSQFFAYHVDDAATTTIDTPIYQASIFDPDDPTDYHYPGETIIENYPQVNKNAENTEMTVDFVINGSQDLLAGAALDDTDNLGSYSAKTARHGVVPNIVMEHLLSRLKFTIYRGDELAKNIQITGITIKEVKNTGKMIVAYKDAPSVEDLIIWQDDVTADFKLMQSPTPIIDNTEADPLCNNKNPLIDLLPINISEIEDWMQEPDPAHPGQTIRHDGNGDGDTDDVSMPAGAGMFVAPGAPEYEMILDYKVLVRDNDDPEDGFTEPGTPANPTDGDLIEKMQVKYPLKAPTTAPTNEDGEHIFAKGKSYNINITVYGLQPITATVELTEWDENGDVWIGGDDTDNKPENLVP